LSCVSLSYTAAAFGSAWVGGVHRILVYERRDLSLAVKPYSTMLIESTAILPVISTNMHHHCTTLLNTFVGLHVGA